MDELFNQSMEDMLTGMSQEFSAFMPAEDVMASVDSACEFFHIDEPSFVTEGWSTGVFTQDPITMLDDVMIYNSMQLESLGITGQDAVDLVMTHEGTHRMLQGMEMGFNSHQEELCCDYMAGVRAGLNGMDTSQLIDALDNSMESSTHPEGAFRVAAIQAGMEFAHQFEQQPAPTFSECLEEFKSGSMHDIVELVHLKDEMFSHECTMRHYQRALESDPNNESLQQHFYDSEARYHFAKFDHEGKQTEIEVNRIEKEMPDDLRHGNSVSFEGKNELSSYAKSIIRTHQDMADRDLEKSKWCQSQAEKAEHRGDHNLAKDYLGRMKMYTESYHRHMDVIESWSDDRAPGGHHNPSFGKAPASEISKLQSKVNEAQHNVDVKRQNVHNWTMNHNYNPDDPTAARRLSEAKRELSIAEQQLNDAKYKLNHAG